MGVSMFFKKQINNELINNFEDIIRENINDKGKINWDNISKYEKLDSQFIYKYYDKMLLENLIRYQKLSTSVIKFLLEDINRNNLWMLLITYQKLNYYFIKDLVKDMNYWKLLIINQKLGNIILFNIIKIIKEKYPEQEKEYVQLICKYQYKIDKIN